MSPQNQDRFIDLFDVRHLARNTRLGLDAPIHLVFLLLVVLVGLGGWLAHYHTRLLYENQAQVSQTYRLLAQLQLVMATAVDAETGARGYIATGREAYLDPYRAAIPVVDARLAELSLLAAEHENQGELVELLTARVHAHFEFLNRIVSSGLGGAREAAIEALRSGDGKQLLDGIRDVIDRVTEREQELLGERRALASRSFRTADLTGLLIAISGVFLIVVLYNLILRFEKLRNRSTLEIANAQQRFEVALGSIGDAVIVTDREGRLAYCNDGCRSTLQLQSQDLGRPLGELITSISGGASDIPGSIVRRAIEEGGIHRTTVDTEIRLSDGSQIQIDATAARIQGHDDQSQGVVLVVRDVSARRERERELARSHERFRSLVLATSQIVWTTDAEGRVREDSPSWRAYTGQTYEQWSGFGWLDALHAGDRERTLFGWKRAIAEQRPFVAEYRLRRADGAYCWNVVRAVPVRDNDGTIREWIGMNHDIDSRKRAEQSQRDEGRRKDEFIALLAHELRNPLAPLRNGLEILKSRSESDAPRVIKMMDSQVAHMVRLIDDLLDVSRIGQGKLELRLECIDLRLVLSEAVDSVTPRAARKNQSLHVKVLSGPMWVHGDAVRLNQVFTNLLSNAIKYSGASEEIWLTAEREGMRYLVSVRDSGQGIATDLRPRIWDLFLQGSGQIERAEGGLGIGLTLVKQLVELHDGTVEVHSDGVGMGSEFTVRLPLVSVPDSDVRTPSGPAETATRALRILVIDDNEDSAESTAMLLRLRGHDVRTAFRGEAGIVEFARFGPELVLCDIRMPDMTGYEVARRVRSLKNGRAVLLVALTGFGTQLDREASVNAGFDQHFVKPVDPDALMELLRAAAERTAGTSESAR